MRVLIIGRSQKNDVVINDPYVSRNHMQLVFHDNGQVSVVDLNSKTGTYVNGTKIQGEHFINPNDIIKIGSQEIPWQTFIQSSNFAETIADAEEDPNEELFEENISFFDKNKTKLLIGLFSILILGGATYFLKENNHWPFAKNEIDTNHNNKEEKKEDANDENTIDGDTYSLSLPKTFEEDDNSSDEKRIYGDDENKTFLELEVINKEDFKKKHKKYKKVKEDELLSKLKETNLKEFLKDNNELKEKKYEETDINDLNAYLVTLIKVKGKKGTDKKGTDKKGTDISYAERSYIEGKDNFYILYLYTKSAKKSTRKTIENIRNSFKENEEQDNGDKEDSNSEE